jgi:hypothetical protein
MKREDKGTSPARGNYTLGPIEKWAADSELWDLGARLSGFKCCFLLCHPEQTAQLFWAWILHLCTGMIQALELSSGLVMTINESIHMEHIEQHQHMVCDQLVSLIIAVEGVLVPKRARTDL